MMRPQFTPGGLSKFFAKNQKTADRLIIRELLLLGEKIVNLCRDLDTYQDDTGNLRSSIGYTLFVDFVPYKTNTQQHPGKGSSTGEDGKNAAESVLETLAQSVVSTRYSLVITAGMNYAEEVEMKNYAVLSPGALLAEQEFPKIKERLRRALSKAA